MSLPATSSSPAAAASAVASSSSSVSSASSSSSGVKRKFEFESMLEEDEDSKAESEEYYRQQIAIAAARASSSSYVPFHRNPKPKLDHVAEVNEAVELEESKSDQEEEDEEEAEASSVMEAENWADLFMEHTYVAPKWRSRSTIVFPLVKDTLGVVLGFSSLKELHTCAQVSTFWCDTIVAMAPIGATFSFSRRETKWKVYGAKLLKQSRKPLSILFRHVQILHIGDGHYHSNFRSLPEVQATLDSFPRLTTVGKLTIHEDLKVDTEDQQARLAVERAAFNFRFPANLTSLDVRFTTRDGLKMCEAISKLEFIKTLLVRWELRGSNEETDDEASSSPGAHPSEKTQLKYEVLLAPLMQATSIESLHIETYLSSSVEFNRAAISTLARMSHLTSIGVDGKVSLEDLKCMQAITGSSGLNKLERFDLMDTKVTPTFLTALHRLAPNLTSIHAFQCLNAEGQLDASWIDLSIFPHLMEVQLRLPAFVADGINMRRWDPEVDHMQLANQVAQASSKCRITSISLDNLNMSTGDIERYLALFPHLNKVQLVNMYGIDRSKAKKVKPFTSLDFLTKGPLSQRLTHLALDLICITEKEVVKLSARSLPNLQELTLFTGKRNSSLPRIKALCQFFNAFSIHAKVIWKSHPDRTVYVLDYKSALDLQL